MFESIGRSFEITKLSFNVVRQDKELFLFPILAGFFSLIYIIALIFPVLFTDIIAKAIGEKAFEIAQYAIYFVVYLGLAVIATFFNVCVVYTTKKRFEGGNSSVGEAISFAFSRIHLIILWGIVSATVGLILRLIENATEKAGAAGQLIGRIVVAILGGAWGIMTIFVVPAMVYDGLGPKGAIQKSLGVLSKTWGESLMRHFALGFAQMSFVILGVIIGIILMIATASISPMVSIIILGLVVLYVIGVVLLFQILNNIFNTALYVYADKGIVPSAYPQELLQNAFKAKQKKKFF
jgi:hypothetical protein